MPEAKEGADIGIDYGIRNTVTTSTGKRLQRLETGALEDEARALRAYARGRCKKRSRRYQDLYREAKKLSRKIARIHDNWEREAAKTLLITYVKLMFELATRWPEIPIAGGVLASCNGSFGQCWATVTRSRPTAGMTVQDDLRT